MLRKISGKIRANIQIYKDDLRKKGLYWSIVHRLYKVSVLKTLLTPIVNFLKPDSVTVHGLKLYIDKLDTAVSPALIIDKVWESYQTALLKKYVKNGDVCIDLGAHIGYYTLLASKLVGKSGKVYAFEPDARNFALLKKSVVANDLANVVCEQLAVSDSVGRARFYTNPENTGDHHLYQTEEHRSYVDVKTTTLDEYFRHIHWRGATFVKMDIQGSEGRALKGAEKFLRLLKKCTLLTEFWPTGLNMAGSNPSDVLRELLHSGFTLYRVDEKKKSTALVSEKQLLQPMKSSEFAYIFAKK